VLDGFALAREAHGQERILVHCAVAAKGGKTVGKDRETGQWKRLSTEDYAFSAMGVLVASYRMASLSALGMVESIEPLEDGERGVITLTASVAAQDGQIGQVIFASAKAGVNGLVLPMARDLSDLGIRVNSIMPGIFATPLMLGAPQNVLDSLAPKSATTPIAMGISEQLGGFPSLTAVLVITTGILGAVSARFIYHRLGIKDAGAQGFALGLASHGIGTARALQVSEVTGAFSALAMGLNGLATSLLAPLILHLLRQWLWP